jgi:membrane protein
LGNGITTRKIFLASLKNLFEKESPTAAAAIAYFSLFSIFPGIILLVIVCNHFIGVLDLRVAVIKKILELFPGARSLIVDNLWSVPPEGTTGALWQPSWGLIFSCLTIFLWSASWVFMFVENALNRAWHVQTPRSFWRSRLLMISMILLCCTLLASSIILTGIVAFARATAARINTGIMPESIFTLFWQLVLTAVGFFLTITVFLLIYKIIPNTRVRLIEALTGALIASVQWQIANYIFVRSIPYFTANYQRVYGQVMIYPIYNSLGAIIVLLSWVYLSCLIMLYGAHFSVQLHRRIDADTQRAVPYKETFDEEAIFNTVKK